LQNGGSTGRWFGGSMSLWFDGSEPRFARTVVRPYCGGEGLRSGGTMVRRYHTPATLSNHGSLVPWYHSINWGCGSRRSGRGGGRSNRSVRRWSGRGRRGMHGKKDIAVKERSCGLQSTELPCINRAIAVEQNTHQSGCRISSSVFSGGPIFWEVQAMSRHGRSPAGGP
jgi:hypothetical protein